MKIAVIMGGTSSEREVSLSSGKNITDALRERGHETIALDTVLPIEQLHTEMKVTAEHLRQGGKNLIALLQEPEPQAMDFIFNALHGGDGENGIVQGILQTMGFKFNGSRAEGCAIAMDKVITKMIFEKHAIRTPRWLFFDRNDDFDYERAIPEILDTFDVPLVVKPGHEGSTVGLTVVTRTTQLRQAIDEALKYNSSLVVEEFINGRELTAAVMGERALPIIEIIPKHGIYDYTCKYTHGMSRYEVPARIAEDITRSIHDLTVKAFKLLRCSGYGRMDLRLSEDGRPYFLEMNALPGMTATSLVPKAALAEGISFGEFLEQIIQLGLEHP